MEDFPSARRIIAQRSGHAKRKNAAKKKKRKERVTSRGINAERSSRVEPSRADGGSDESATHLAIVPDRSSRGDREHGECRYPVVDLERKISRRGGHVCAMFLLSRKNAKLYARCV